MCDFQIKVTEILECPICNRMPRTLPVMSCSAGHIVCDSCMDEDVVDCPQCRARIHCTNTLAGQLVSIAVHSCSFRYLGCNVGLNIDEIASHEKVCPERTTKCIFRYRQYINYVFSFEVYVCSL